MQSEHEFCGLPLDQLPGPVVTGEDFVIAAAFLDHGHIYGQCHGLVGAGARLRWVYDPNPAQLDAFRRVFPQVRVARSYEEILNDPEVALVTTAAVPSTRGQRSIEALRAGKHVLADKPPFITLADLAAVKQAVRETGRRFAVYYSERLHNEASMLATDLVAQDKIGRVLQVIGLGPHREGKGRPEWFYDKAHFGGILCDIGSHQFEQFLTYASAEDATVLHSSVANYEHPEHPAFEDFGQANLLANNGATNFVRVDWFTPAGLRTWGDGRITILGTKGYIELRKYIDVARSAGTDHVFLVDNRGEHSCQVQGRYGFRFFGQLILDCLNGTENSMTQSHAFKAAELALLAQSQAVRLA